MHAGSGGDVCLSLSELMNHFVAPQECKGTPSEMERGGLHRWSSIGPVAEMIFDVVGEGPASRGGTWSPQDDWLSAPAQKDISFPGTQMKNPATRPRQNATYHPTQLFYRTIAAEQSYSTFSIVHRVNGNRLRAVAKLSANAP